MFSLWHSHQHATSSSSVYSNLYIPYIIKDKYSDYIDKYFTINENVFTIIYVLICIFTINSNKRY